MKLNFQIKKTLFSGIQPSGSLHIGNYLGAIKQWKEMYEDYNSIFCIVDFHAITNKYNPDLFKSQILEIAKIYLASGIDPKKAIIFQQSRIKEHTELTWILNCVAARISDLNKMTQFKDKAGKNKENVSVGLYDYPVLMAADILLYHTDIVPVGEDQKQHVELARDLAKRFNNVYGEIFKIPEVIINKEGARIKALNNPVKKMSKSDNNIWGCIYLLDNPEVAVKKIKRAVTDSDSEIKYDKLKKPAISNLLNIYALFSGQDIKELEKKYQGKGYGDFKKDLAEIISNFLDNFQKKYYQYSDSDVKDILELSIKKLQPIATDTMNNIKEKLGITI